MDSSFAVLLGGAATIALVHTAIGVDHYLPFIVLSRAEGWSLRRTLAWTTVCGLGHVASSVALGLVGVALGWAAGSVAGVQESRGSLAGYLLIAFGLAYLAWDIWTTRRGHEHVHAHADGTVHSHPHAHGGQPHDHDDTTHLVTHRRSLWALFIIFVLGPCEPLIPLLVAPAAQHSLIGAAAVVAVFTAVTIGTMIAFVIAGVVGLRFVRLGFLERRRFALAGIAILISGVLISAFGL